MWVDLNNGVSEMQTILGTWREPGCCRFWPSGPRSVAAAPELAPPGRCSFGPAQEGNERGAQH